LSQFRRPDPVTSNEPSATRKAPSRSLPSRNPAALIRSIRPQVGAQVRDQVWVVAIPQY